MKKKDASFWSEIKSLDERLAREPDSFCFARLSETYLKVGLVADALHTARHGVARHPGYLAGQRALAMACNASDLRDECLAILEQVTAAMPEDVEAQKLLAGLYIEAGDASAAVRTYSTVLDFRPDDVQSKLQMETLQQSGLSGPAVSSATVEAVTSEEKAVEEKAEEDVTEEEEILELDESDIVYDEELSEEEAELIESPETELTGSAHHDPLSTLTLAELYEQQGFIAKALDIYQAILVDDPDNTLLQAKITQLEEQEAAPESLPEQPAAESAIADEFAPFTPDAFEDVAPSPESPSAAPAAHDEVSFTEVKPFTSAAFDDMPAPLATQDLSPFVHKEADNVLGTLDGWLENIRRIKACR